MSAPQLTLRDIYLARQRIAPVVRRTPLAELPSLAAQTGLPVRAKLESVQHTGSFKLRGAANKVLSLTNDEKARGVVTVSSGNHGRALSYVARREGVQATVCITSRVPKNKVAAIERLGAEVVIAGESQEEAELHALQLQKEQNLIFVHPFDDPLVIAGQGTIGLEILEDWPAVNTVIVPMSGGGLIAGIGLALKSASRAIRVVGVTMERGAAMYHSLKAGKLVDVVEEDTLADALAGGLGSANNYSLGMCQQYVDETVLVSEEEIAGAMAFALAQEHLVIEGGAAVGLAAMLHHKLKLADNDSVALVVSGNNVDFDILREVVRKHSP